MTRYIEELFNITLHPTSVTWSNYKERYQILSATDSLPDLFATLTLSSTDNNDSATFTDMIETGSIRALPKTCPPILLCAMFWNPSLSHNTATDSIMPSPGFLFWIFVFTAGYAFYRRNYKVLLPFALIFLVWLTVILGPTYLPRYVLILWFALPGAAAVLAEG